METDNYTEAYVIKIDRQVDRYTDKLRDRLID